MIALCGAVVLALRPVYRHVEELLAERGITVDHVTVDRWVQTFTPEFIGAARLARQPSGDLTLPGHTCIAQSTNAGR